jgi:hypothetical protein
MGYLQQTENEAIAPMTSVFAKASPLNVSSASVIEQFGYAALQHISKTKVVNHAGEVTISGTRSTERQHRGVSAKAEI